MESLVLKPKVHRNLREQSMSVVVNGVIILHDLRLKIFVSYVVGFLKKTWSRYILYTLFSALKDCMIFCRPHSPDPRPKYMNALVGHITDH